MDLKTYRARWRMVRRKAQAERLQRAQQQQQRQDNEPPTPDPEMQRRIRADLAKMRATFSGEED